MADFGTDIRTFPDLDPAFSSMSGIRVVAEAIARRLTTPRGGLIYSPDYGTDVRSYLNDSVTQDKITQWQRELQRECEKEERVDSADVTISYDATSQTMKVSVSLVTADGPFTLVLGVPSLSLSILDAR